MTDLPLLDRPVLDGDLVRLRAHERGDLEPIYERCLDPDTRRFTTIPLEYTREMAAEYLDGLLAPSAAEISWAIEVDGAYAGTIDLRRKELDKGGGSLGYVTHQAFRGRGVMTEAVRLVVGHAFDTLGWELVQWEAHVGNFGSAKAVWHNGFPTPVHVPALLVERGHIVDGWISTLANGDPREPSVPWAEVRAVLETHVSAVRWHGSVAVLAGAVEL